MYTEDEAREKWCPHALRRHAAVSVETCGRGVRDEPITFCIGSACMAWRWGADHVEEQPGKFKAVERGDRVYREPADPVHTPTGYCGLSGSPYMGGE